MSRPTDNDQGRRLRTVADYVCRACHTAFASDTIQCPGCRRLRPHEGWRAIAANTDRWLGTSIDGRYTLIQRVGRGAAGAVYRGMTTHTGETIAAKMIDFTHSNFGSDIGQVTDRTQREVEVLCRVRNPHVLGFFDYVELPGPVGAIITEYIDGRTLESIMSREAPLEPARALELARQIAFGMTDVHRLGAVHRDLKPDNLLVQTLHPADEFVHIIDFGIARMHGRDESEATFVGTPLYASPEQARGLDVTHLSDIYALGTILYAMLTGRTLFDDRSPRIVLQKHVDEPAPSLEDSRPGGGFPPGMVDLVGAMLAKDPEERPQSMLEVAEAISEILWDRVEPVSLTEDLPAAELSDAFDEMFGGDPSIQPGGREETGPRPEVPPPTLDPTRAPDIGRSDDMPVLAFSTDGAVVTVAVGNHVELRSPVDADVVHAVWSPEVSVTALATAGNHLLVGHADGTIARLDRQSGGVESIHRDQQMAPISALAETPDGSLAVVGSHGGRLTCGEGPSDLRTWHVLPTGPPVTAAAVDADTRSLALGRSDRQTTLFTDHRSRWGADVVLTHDSVPRFLRFSEDGYLLAAYEKGGTLAMFDVASGQLLSRREACPVEIGTVFSQPNAVGCRASCMAVGDNKLPRCGWLTLE